VGAGEGIDDLRRTINDLRFAIGVQAGTPLLISKKAQTPYVSQENV